MSTKVTVNAEDIIAALGWRGDPKYGPACERLREIAEAAVIRSRVEPPREETTRK